MLASSKVSNVFHSICLNTKLRTKLLVASSFVLFLI